MTRPLLGAGLLQHDLLVLELLRAEGLLVDLGTLEALVLLRRARSYGQGPRTLVEAIARLEARPTIALPSTARSA